MAKQSPQQKDTVERVMHEFKHGELKQNGGAKVKNPKQAIAIALRESGSSNEESPADNRKALRKTKAKESRGETAQAAAEGKSRAQAKSAGGRKPAAKNRAGSAEGMTRTALYAEAKKRDIPGRSKMSKEQLARALHA